MVTGCNSNNNRDNFVVASGSVFFFEDQSNSSSRVAPKRVQALPGACVRFVTKSQNTEGFISFISYLDLYFPDDKYVHFFKSVFLEMVHAYALQAFGGAF